MWISFYNKKGIGDTLLLSSGTTDRYNVSIKTVGDITQVSQTDTGQVIGYNLANISKYLDLGDRLGSFELSPQEQNKVLDLVKQAEFDTSHLDLTPKAALVVGYVETCQPHPDSDHLSITQTRISENQVLQIVCGASNVKAGQKVVVASPGTVMPNGAIIWPGQLRGLDSFGMLCSARELGIDTNNQKKGILVLGEAAPVGAPFTKEIYATFQ